jgi:hypothetical protein
MGPFTKQTCEVCAQVFEMPMWKGRHGGYFEGLSTLHLSYCEDDDITFDPCCADCAESIRNSVRNAVAEIKGAK